MEGILVWGLYMRDPIILESMLGPRVFGNSRELCRQDTNIHAATTVTCRTCEGLAGAVLGLGTSGSEQWRTTSHGNSAEVELM